MRNVYRITVQVLFIALLFGTFLGCAERKGAKYHQEPVLSAKQVATLSLFTVENFNLLAGVELIDGKSTDRSWDWDQLTTLTPGQHEIGVAISHRTFLQIFFDEIPVHISVIVKAGHRYQIHVRRENALMRVWMEDYKTKEIVGVATVIGASGS